MKSDWFWQTLTLEHQSWFQNVPFKLSLRRYSVGLCFLLVFSYAVQYLVRHGVIVAPTVRN